MLRKYISYPDPWAGVLLIIVVLFIIGLAGAGGAA